MTNLMKPKALKKGDTIGVFAPSSRVDESDMINACQFWRDNGFNVHLHDQLKAKDEAFAGSAEQKVNALKNLFEDTNIDAIICARGGNGAMRMLSLIDFEVIRQNPKIFMGYSDVTALNHAIFKETRLSAIHGPIFKEFKLDFDAHNQDVALSFLMGKTDINYFEGHDVSILSSGKVSGPMFGGNLALFSALMMSGDKRLPDLNDAILVLEDIGEDLSRLDRTLTALNDAGVFEKISGVIMGVTPIPEVEEIVPFGRSLEKIFRENTQGINIPIILDAPFGHRKPNYPFPMGAQAELDATGSKPTLRLLESPFAP